MEKRYRNKIIIIMIIMICYYYLGERECVPESILSEHEHGYS